MAPAGRYACVRVCACVCFPPPHISTVHLSPGVPKQLSECIVDVESMDIFPVGWCEANAYPLAPPIKAVCTYTHTWTCTDTHTAESVCLFLSVGQKQKKIAVVQPEKQ